MAQLWFDSKIEDNPNSDDAEQIENLTEQIESLQAENTHLKKAVIYLENICFETFFQNISLEQKAISNVNCHVLLGPIYHK